MGTKLKVGKAANLTEYWRDSIAEALNEELDQLPEEQRFVVNCASQVLTCCKLLELQHVSTAQGHTSNIPRVFPQEYFKAVDTKLLSAPVINVAFQDNSTFRVPTQFACTALSLHAVRIVCEHAV